LANTEITLSLNSESMAELLGAGDRNLNAVSSYFHTDIINRDDRFILVGADEKTAARIESVLSSLSALAEKGMHVSLQDTIYTCRLAARDQKIDFLSMAEIVIGRTAAGRTIFPKTLGQMRFAQAMNEKTIVFATGPAGTGKTYLAVTSAVSALKKGDVKRIVLTRPAVEAGENLGFLPGDLKEKVDPYLTPLYDALHDMLGAEQSDRLLEKGTIEIAPLAYMRGRTLNDAFIILDEAQNTTASQMKMFLTRLGFHSRMVITGDVTQIDLNGKTESGLLQAVRILEGLDDISVIAMSADDVVRNPLVQKIIERYEAAGRH
jgi:phosphate starvation-inducible PhoH-like protein